MKIMNSLTLRYLKENKKRTILTILCITISVIMISCVGFAFYSGKEFFKESIEKNTGDYHYTMIENDKRIISYIQADKKIKEYYLSNTQEVYFDDKEINDKNILIKSGDNNYFKKYNYQNHLISGRLPNNPNEINISKQYLHDNHIDKDIGDSLIFKKKLDNGEYKEFNYSIVGIINNFKNNKRYGSLNDAISYIDINNIDYYSLYVQDKEVSTQIFEHTKQISQDIKEIRNNDEKINIAYNSSYLAIQDIFEKNSQSFFLSAYKLIAVILVIICILSLFIIYQAFNLSTYDRIQYLGMLSSVGATPKQKKRSVYYEGFLISLIGIPLGIIISFIGLSITFFFLNQLDIVKNMQSTLNVNISLSYLVGVIIICLITVFISLYLPARKISKISVIDALRKSDEVKVKSKRLKSGLFSKKFLNINQQLAIKNYKRQGKRSKVIVFSLVISMVAFIGVFSFGNNLLNTFDKAQDYERYDININIAATDEEINKLSKLLDKNEYVDFYYYDTNINVNLEYNEEFIKYYENYQLLSDYIEIVGIDNRLYNQICKDNNIQIKEKQGLVFNHNIIDENGERIKLYEKVSPQYFQSLTYIEGYDDDNNPVGLQQLPLFDYIELIDEDKYKVSPGPQNGVSLVVPIDYILKVEKESVYSVNYMVYSSDYKALANDLDENHYGYYNNAEQTQQSRQMAIVVQTFIYGFVLLLILFTLMNIINMMNSSISKRKKEFAMMLSMGMSPKGIKKIILYESLIYGFKTFLYGVPLSIAIEYFIFKMTYGNNGDPFHISILAYLISFLIIMLVMVITFRFSLRKLNKQNIIESLKDDI